MNAAAIEALFGAGLAALGPDRRSEAWGFEEAEMRTGESAHPLNLVGRRMVCLRALVLLWHDHLDAAHGLVQDLPGADAAFVHGIMHRREPDYSNARYWFHRVGAHPVYDALAEQAAPLLAEHAALPCRLIREGLWDGFAFIEAVATTLRQPVSTPEHVMLRQLQRLESVVLARHLAGV